jgi:hypothetical protein
VYWSGIAIAVAAVIGAVGWNGVAFIEYRMALSAINEKIASSDIIIERMGVASEWNYRIVDEKLISDVIEGRHDRERSEATRRERRYQGTVLKHSLFLLGGGIIAFGFGWAARYVIRGPFGSD